MPKHNDEKAPIIVVKKVKKVSGHHAATSWKVAYADFVTAMMAFFLLLWLLSVTTEEQKHEIAAYFSPADPRVAQSVSGAGGVLGGLSLSPEGAMTSDLQPLIATPDAPAAGIDRPGRTAEEIEWESRMDSLDRQDSATFEQLAEELRQAIDSIPELKELADHLIIDQTPEGLRIQIIDQKGRSMFPVGRVEPLPHAAELLKTVAGVIQKVPNKVSVRGHTDSLAFPAGAPYTNWELSADRANASRRVLLEGGLGENQVHDVQGRSDREHLLPEEPTSPRNRRITIMLLRQSLVEGLQQAPQRPGRLIPRRREEGIIYFP